MQKCGLRFLHAAGRPASTASQSGLSGLAAAYQHGMCKAVHKPREEKDKGGFNSAHLASTFDIT